MHLTINPSSDRPVYQQLIDQIKRDIALDRLRVGDKLPTVRQLAAKLLINPNTIAKVYRTLESDGIIRTRPGAGAFVSEIDSQLSLDVRRRIICEQLERVFVDAVHMQISAATLRKWFEDLIKKYSYLHGETSHE
ncbi:MAG: GntR family transcriptional regulator [Sedimentisphaerales bacterium]|nr:GntR family transcriptional regulator [Sedimentisphaerales bacterium]